MDKAETLEAVKGKLQGVVCILDAMAQQGTEESNALTLLARALDSAYMDLDGITARETEA